MNSADTLEHRTPSYRRENRLVRNKLIIKLLIAIAVLTGCAHADVLYTIPTGTTYNSLGLSGWADFFLSGCNSSGANCTLNIALEDTQANETSASQAISGVTFTLTNAGTQLTYGTTAAIGGTISTTDTSTGNAPTAVTLITNSGSTSTTTSTSATQWHITPNTVGATWGTGTLALTVIGTQPIDLIAGPGSGTGGSFKPHSPSILGANGSTPVPIYFQITGISGLSTATDLSNVTILMGTGPDSIVANGNCSSGNLGTCGGDIGGGGGSVPEPMSFLLAGAGLIGLAFGRRFISARPVK